MLVSYQNNLKQTWEEWNFVELNYNSPNAKAIYATIKAALDSYEGDRDTFRAALKVKLQNAGITAAEIASLRL